jgi:hypothetical protein
MSCLRSPGLFYSKAKPGLFRARKFSRGILVGAVLVSSAFGQITYEDIRVPKGMGYGFPTSEARLTSLRDLQDTSEIRKHAWAIFAGITASSIGVSASPIFETWYTKSETLSGNGCSHPSTGTVKRELEFPPEIVAAYATKPVLGDRTPLSQAVEFFSSPTTSIASNVLYNSTACDHIQHARLYDSVALKSLIGHFDELHAPPQERDVSPFPKTSIVVKAFWKLIDRSGLTTLEIWNSPKDKTSVQIGVIPAHQRPCNLPRQNDAPVLSSCFYSVLVTPSNLAEIKKVRPAEVGDVLVLIGLHVITKEISDWSWSTFWWNPEETSLSYGADRPKPPLIRGPWRFYLMDATLSTETPWESHPATGEKGGEADPCGQTIGDKNGIAKVILNPYLEHVGSMTNAEVSNCMNCHKRATFTPLQPEMRGSPRRGFLASENVCFSKVVRLDYLWSLAPTEGTPIQSFLHQLRTALKLE